MAISTVNIATWKTDQTEAAKGTDPAYVHPGPPTIIDIPSIGVCRAVVKANGINGQDVINVLHGAYNIGDPLTRASTDDLTALIKAWLDGALPDLLTLLKNDYAIVEYIMYVYDLYNLVWVNIGTTAAADTGDVATGNALPQQTAVKMTVNTAISQVQGGNYFAGFPSSVMTVNGTINTATLTGLATFATSLFSPFVGVTGTLYPGVWSTTMRTLGAARAIIINDVMDVIRRRKIGKGS